MSQNVQTAATSFGGFGIYLSSPGAGVSVVGNSVTDDNYGIYTISAQGGSIANNQVSGSSADGKGGPNIDMEMIHAGNAKHAQEFANVSKADTLALHKSNVAAASAMLRGLNDADFDKSGPVLKGMPPMSAGQLAGGLLCGHMDEHLNSIKATIGR